MRRTALALLILLGACTGGYPEGARRFMQDACSNDDPLCACMFRAVQAEIPYEDYRRYMFENEALPDAERRRINAELNRLNQSCAGPATPSPAAERP